MILLKGNLLIYIRGDYWKVIILEIDSPIQVDDDEASQYTNQISFNFPGSLSESQQDTVTLQELDEHAMETVVDFFYSGEIEISENNVQDLLPVTCLLQVKSLQQACCEFLKRQLSSENCLGNEIYQERYYSKQMVT